MTAQVESNNSQVIPKKGPGDEGEEVCAKAENPLEAPHDDDLSSQDKASDKSNKTEKVNELSPMLREQAVQTSFPVHSSESSEDTLFTEGSMASRFEVVDFAIRGINEAGSLDGSPRIQVLGSHRGAGFEIQVNSNLNSELTYGGRRFFVPLPAVVAALLLSTAFSLWLIFYGLPMALSSAPSLSPLSTPSSGGAPEKKEAGGSFLHARVVGSLLHPRTLDDYGILWLAWHSLVYVFEKVWRHSGIEIPHLQP